MSRTGPVPPSHVRLLLANDTKRLQEKLLDTVDLAQYAIRGTDADWEAATKRSKATQGGSGTVSIKTKVRACGDEDGHVRLCPRYLCIFVLLLGSLVHSMLFFVFVILFAVDKQIQMNPLKVSLNVMMILTHTFSLPTVQMNCWYKLFCIIPSVRIPGAVQMYWKPDV